MAPITGRKVFIGFAGAFGIIIGVNVLMAYQAVHTFPGLEVKNGYIASQAFNRNMAAQKALGWDLKMSYERARLILTFDKAASSSPDVSKLAVLVGRPTEAREDKEPAFTRSGTSFIAPVDLHPGKWMVVVRAEATDGTPFLQRLTLFVPG